MDNDLKTRDIEKEDFLEKKPFDEEAYRREIIEILKDNINAFKKYDEEKKKKN